jgi:hypothetical protein
MDGWPSSNDQCKLVAKEGIEFMAADEESRGISVCDVVSPSKTCSIETCKSAPRDVSADTVIHEPYAGHGSQLAK